MRSRRTFWVLAMIGVAITVAASGAVSRAAQEVFVLNWPAVQRVEGTVTIERPVRLSTLVRRGDLIVAPVHPSDTTRLIDGGLIEAEGFGHVTLSLLGTTKGEVGRSGTVGAFLVLLSAVTRCSRSRSRPPRCRPPHPTSRRISPVSRSGSRATGCSCSTPRTRPSTRSCTPTCHPDRKRNGPSPRSPMERGARPRPGRFVRVGRTESVGEVKLSARTTRAATRPRRSLRSLRFPYPAQAKMRRGFRPGEPELAGPVTIPVPPTGAASNPQETGMNTRIRLLSGLAVWYSIPSSHRIIVSFGSRRVRRVPA